MRYLAAATLSMAVMFSVHGDALAAATSSEAIRSVSPVLERYTESTLKGEVWKRPDLSPRDRSVVTVAALIARGQAGVMPEEFGRALDNGVSPAELSEIITHLAFYSGWPNAMSAVAVTSALFAGRGVGADRLPAIEAEKLPLDEAAEAQRESRVQGGFGATSQGVVDYTRDLLFLDLWLRPGLKPRDRSLVTVSALIAVGQVEQMTFHLNKAMDNGLSKAEASEMLTQLAFYAGWPRVFSALPVAREVFNSRPR